MKRLLLMGLCMVLLAGCDDHAEESCSGSSNYTEIQDLTQYQDEVSEIFAREFAGIVADGGQAITCAHDGGEFLLNLGLSSAMECLGSESEPAECAEACSGEIEIEGELVFGDDAPISIVGVISLFNGPTPLSAALHLDGDYLHENFGDKALEAMDFDSTITVLDWSVSQEDEVWESCVLTVVP